MQRRTILCRAHRHFGARAHNLHPQRTRPPVQLFDPHEGAHRLGFRQNPLGDPLGQRFQKVQPFRGEFRRDGFGDAVIRQDAVDIILQRRGMGAHFDHHVKADALALPAFLLEGPDLDLDDMVAQADPVARVGAGTGLGPLFGVGESKADVGCHGFSRAGCALLSRGRLPPLSHGRQRRQGARHPRGTACHRTGCLW